MKSLIALSILIIYFIKQSKFPSRLISQHYYNIESIYTIEYRTYNNLKPEINYLTELEQNIFNALNSVEGYDFLVDGGWVRDKILNLNTSAKPDIDLTVDAMTLDTLENILNQVFVYLQNISAPINDTSLFMRPYGREGYGKYQVRLYGIDMDVEIMAKSRTITPVPSFIPTRNIQIDAKQRELSINAIYYNVKTKEIYDPLYGLEAFKKGIIETIKTENVTFPFKDFLEIFGVIKDSAKYEMKLGPILYEDIKTNLNLIKQYMYIYKNSKTMRRLSKIASGEFAIKSFKILYDWKLLDAFLPEDYLYTYSLKPKEYSNLLFNLVAISEAVIRINLINDYIYNDEERLLLYYDSFKIIFFYFDEYVGIFDCYNKGINCEINVDKRQALLSLAKIYCDNFNCEKKILKEIDLVELIGFVSQFEHLKFLKLNK